MWKLGEKERMAWRERRRWVVRGLVVGGGVGVGILSDVRASSLVSGLIVSMSRVVGWSNAVS